MIDYPRIRAIGERIVSDRMERIARGIDKKQGYVVFNPNSFEGCGLVKLNGKSAIVSGVPSKGWLATKDFVTENHVRVDGRIVDTDCLTVRFDDAWQIASIYDKKNDREVLRAGECDTLPARYSAISLDQDHVICETVKAAEDGDGTIVRFFETKNRRGKVRVTLGFPASKAYLCDLMENELEELDVVDGSISLKVSPFEIVTMKVK